VVTTGTWLEGRSALISPMLGTLDSNAKTVEVNLTRNQIENSPPINTRQPVSRQHETAYFDYYGYPSLLDRALYMGAHGLPFQPAGSERN
jgi:hypothetical protein